MNGFFNILAALVLGCAVVWTGYALSQDGDDDNERQRENEQIAQRSISEAEQRYQQDCETAGVNCEETAADPVSGLEDPYTPGVATRPYAGSPAIAANTRSEPAPLEFGRLSSEEDDTSVATARGLSVTERYTGNEATSGESDDSERPVRLAMADDDDYRSATAGLNNSGNAIGVDKQDSKQYFTENRRIDKPDTKDYYTESTPLPQNRLAESREPCIREDGTVYTGPGTVMNPFADTNPCLASEVPTGIAESTTEAAPPIANLPAVEYYPVPPAQPVEIVNRCDYRAGGYTASPITDGNGLGWMADFGCFGAFPPGGFGPQPTLGPGSSDYP